MTDCGTEEIGYLQSINSDKHLPQSTLTGQFFQMMTFCIAFYESYLSTGYRFFRQPSSPVPCYISPGKWSQAHKFSFISPFFLFVFFLLERLSVFVQSEIFTKIKRCIWTMSLQYHFSLKKITFSFLGYNNFLDLFYCLIIPFVNIDYWGTTSSILICVWPFTIKGVAKKMLKSLHPCFSISISSIRS